MSRFLTKKYIIKRRFCQLLAKIRYKITRFYRCYKNTKKRPGGAVFEVLGLFAEEGEDEVDEDIAAEDDG